MCILACGIELRNDFPLVILHLRDEHPARETMFPSQESSVISALDSISQGSFMGFNCETGSFAALTNIRLKGGAQPPEAASRGKLVQSILDRVWSEGETVAFPDSNAVSPADGEAPATHYLGADYANFNMICGRICRKIDSEHFHAHLQLVSNRSWLPLVEERPCHAFVSQVPAGRVFCFSNGTFSAHWRKIEWFRDEIASCIARAAVADASNSETIRTSARSLFEAMEQSILQQRQRFDDTELQASGDELDIGQSDLPSPVERNLRRQVFLSPQPDHPRSDPFLLVTRSLSAVIVTGGLIHYLYRDTTSFPELGPLFHRTVPIPPL